MKSNSSAALGRSTRARVLLLHPEDRYPPGGSFGKWDLIVDFGHATPATHQEWGRQADCRVLNLFDFSEDIHDLYRTRDLVQSGIGQFVDRFGIDWWDVLSVMITPGLLNLQMVRRLAAEVDPQSELYMSRLLPAGQALAKVVGAPLHNLESRARAMLHQAQRYFQVITRLDPALTRQIFQDKFDSHHSIRRRFVPRRSGSRQPMVLLPSAYANVSRAAVSYAAEAPEDQFLVVYARDIAELDSLPANIQAASLDSYFGPQDERELASLVAGWSALRDHMIPHYPEFAAADAAGMLGQVPALLPWGISLRDAWMRLFDAENLTACLTADDSNPYTRLPLIIAKKRGIRALACHHGALDYAMAIKTNYADFYLTRNDMERDYLVNVCRFPPDGIAALALPSPPQLPRAPRVTRDQPWMVFFTENSILPWRGDEVYRELMPLLASLAHGVGLKLVFKLHPFENKRSYAQWLKRYLPGESGQRTAIIITGAPSAELWRNARFALTVQSTAALECYSRGIPVFLCGWLREPSCGYLEQYARYGVGQVLQSPAEVAEIPRLLKTGRTGHSAEDIRCGQTNPVSLHDLLRGSCTSANAGTAQSMGD